MINFNILNTKIISLNIIYPIITPWALYSRLTYLNNSFIISLFVSKP